MYLETKELHHLTSLLFKVSNKGLLVAFSDVQQAPQCWLRMGSCVMKNTFVVLCHITELGPRQTMI